MNPPKLTRHPWCVLIVALCSFPVSQAGGQTASQQVEALRESVTPAPAQTGERALPESGTRAPPGARDVPLSIESIRLVGLDGSELDPASGLPTDKLREVARDGAPSVTTLAGLYDIAREIEVTLRRDGYIFSVVRVPEQTIDQAGADVRVVVIESRIESVEIVEPGDPVGPVMEKIRAFAAPLSGRRNPRVEDLERISLLATDMPGISRAAFVPTAGSGPGNIRLSLNLNRVPLTGVAVVNNRQSPTVGPVIAGGIVSYNSYTSRGDSTELSYFNSVGFDDGDGDLDERNTVQLGHQTFLGAQGLRLYGRALFSRSRPGDELAPLDVEGEQINARIGMEYPVMRTRALSLWLGGGVEIDENTTDISQGTVTAADDSLRVVLLRAEAAQSDATGTSAASLEFRKGLDIFGASDAGDPGLSRVDGEGDFFLIRGDGQRRQSLTDSLEFRARMAWQVSFDPVLASEEFTIGGERFVKAYDPAEQVGDSGFAVSGELAYADRATLEDFNFGYELYGFGDWGIVYNRDEGLPESKDLASAGGGVRFRIPNGPELEFEVAVPLLDPLLRTQDHDLRVFTGLVWPF